MAIVILGALVIGRWRRLGDSGIQVPSMALLSLLTAGGTSEDFTALTMLETLVGGVIGVAVNMLIFAPLHDSTRATSCTASGRRGTATARRSTPCDG